jgi:cyclase
VTFERELTLWCDTTRIDLLHFGTPAHTTNDVVAHLPEQRITYCGDLLFAGGTPFAVQGSVHGWLTALDRLAELDADRLVPGHGQVCGPEEITNTRNYLEFVGAVAERAHRRGLTPLEAALETDLGTFATLTDPERIVGNLHRAYADIDDPEQPGKPLPLPDILGDMQHYHGGPLRSHA